MKRVLSLLICCLVLALSACAPMPSRNSGAQKVDLESLRAQITEVRSGDFGEFMAELHYAETELDQAQSIYDSIQAGKGGDPTRARAAVAQALTHRNNAQAALERIQGGKHLAELFAEHEQRLGYIEALHVEEGVTPPVTRIYFDLNSTQLNQAEHAKIIELVNFLRKYPVFAIKVIGFADTVGSKTYNQHLAERRNRSVIKALRSAGLPVSTMVTFAVGEAEGLEETRNPQNRRVDIKPYVHGRYISPVGNGLTQND